ncbi:MAG: hypothetical protein QM582_03700 [Micropruina sp.]|uniref:hypothetical protein n=1 Tax=Micropruina sp. TaxID=2737536 RepID=UPI0039E53133
MPRTKPVRAVAVGSLLAFALIGGPIVPASAARNELLVSRDGTHFTSGSTLPLFTRVGRVVPGDRNTERVWVKNNSTVDAVLRVDLIDPYTDDPALASAFSLRLAQSGRQESAPVTIETGIRNGTCTVLGGGTVLRPGQDLRLELTAGVDPALDKQHGMLGTVGFRLRGVLTETAAAAPAVPGSRCQEPSEPPGQPTAPGGDTLPTTGSGALLPIGLFGAASVVAGIIFCALAWRRRDTTLKPPGSDDD